MRAPLTPCHVDAPHPAPRGRRYGSRYVAAVLEVASGGKKALVEYKYFNDEHVPDQLLREYVSASPPPPHHHPPSPHTASPARRWVPIGRLRPIPPLTRPDFFDHLHGGER